MGTFNTLHASVACNSCKATYDDRIQFAYGEVWQHNYTVGDKLLWGSNNVGAKGAKRVIVYGISELSSCPVCGTKPDDNEYDIVIINGRVASVQTMEDYSPYFAEEGGRFYIPEGS